MPYRPYNKKLSKAEWRAVDAAFPLSAGDEGFPYQLLNRLRTDQIESGDQVFLRFPTMEIKKFRPLRAVLADGPSRRLGVDAYLR